MAYIGKTPEVGNYIKLDAISTSSTNTYNLTKDSVAFIPESALHMLVSLNGVIQSPLSSFSVSGSTITFLPSSGTLSSSDTIDFILVLGNVLDIGTPSDSTVTNAKTNFVSTSSSAGLQIKGDGTTDGTLQLNCSQNSHGVKIASPAHSAGQSYTLTLPTGNVTASRVLEVESVTGSGATGVGQLKFSGNTPAFEAELDGSGSRQELGANNTNVKVQFNSEIFDSDSAYDHSTNYRFTPQVAGKYFVYAYVGINPEANSNLNDGYAILKKNGTAFAISHNNYLSNPIRYGTCNVVGIVTLNGSSDYVECFAQAGDASGTADIDTGYYSRFGSFRLLGL